MDWLNVKLIESLKSVANCRFHIGYFHSYSEFIILVENIMLASAVEREFFAKPLFQEMENALIFMGK
jgi:hypothetical protein